MRRSTVQSLSLQRVLPMLSVVMTSRVTRLGNLSAIGLLLDAHYDFFKDDVAQNNGDFLGYFLFKLIYYIFTYISSFKTWFVVGILRF